VSTGFVADCSTTMAWCFPDECTPASLELLRRTANEVLCVPALWFIEITNVLALAERKGRISAAKLSEFIALLGRFELDVDNEASSRAFPQLLLLCREHRLTSYDAVYLDLAIRRRLPLATLDADLRKSAKALGIPVL
jgi:predicted nucleic acid-binding protein